MSQGLILNPKGHPFPNVDAARRHIAKAELDELRYVPTKYQGGFAIVDLDRLAEVADMLPKSDAQLKADAERAQAGETKPEPKREYNALSPNVAKNYYRVVFMHKATDNDPTLVPMSISAQVFYLSRNKEYVLPDTYVDVMRNAVTQRWTHEPGQGRQQGEMILRFPFSIMGTATKQEFTDRIDELRENVRAFTRPTSRNPRGERHGMIDATRPHLVT